MAIGELWRELLAGWRGAGEREAWARALADGHERLAAYRRAWQAYYGAYREALPVSAARASMSSDITPSLRPSNCARTSSSTCSPESGCRLA